MASEKAGLRTPLVILGASLCALVAVFLWRGSDVSEVDPTVNVVVTDAAQSEDVAAVEETPAEPPAEPLQGPSIQDVRLEVDGLSVIAGQAEPLSEVILFVEDMEVARTSADASGAFATVATLDPGTETEARPLTVATRGSDGELTRGTDTVILAPLPKRPAQEDDVAQTELSNPAAANTAAVDDPPTPQPATAEPMPESAAPPKIAVLKSDRSGIEVLNPSAPAPQVTGQIALDTISYSNDGAVKLQGRAQGSAQEVRVYLDNSVITALKVDETGAWRGTLPEVETGVFTLRIDEVDADGAVTSRVETPFKREDPAVLDAVVSQDKQALIKAITVQQGNTLWAIARERYGQGTEYVQVFEANRNLIRDPNLIYPGQVLALPQK